MRRCGASLAILLALAAQSSAQVERYDLGLKLRAFDIAWDAQADRNARRRALPELKKVVPLFLAGREMDAGQALDRTRFLLQSAEPATAAERWAVALVSRPSARLLDPSSGPLAVELRTLYDPKVDLPAKAAVVCTLLPADRAGANAVAEPITATPQRVSVAVEHLAEGDYTLRVVIASHDKELATHEHTISVVPQLAKRMKSVWLESAAGGAATTERLTLKALSELLTALVGRSVFETSYPAARLVVEAEALAKSVPANARYYGPERPGQFWVTLAAGRSEAPVRLFVPGGMAADKPVPLVVAMHGLGGSENLFFDAYGHGAIVRECKARGWLLVATRSGGFTDVPPVAGIVDELARLYPVDRSRVFVLGHSMGATHTIDVAQGMSGKIAAVAALGGGGTVRRPEAVKGLPVFVGCGAEDFVLVWSRTLARSLESAGAKVRVKEYADVEHVVVVREALKDVFEFFEAAKGASQKG